MTTVVDTAGVAVKDDLQWFGQGVKLDSALYVKSGEAALDSVIRLLLRSYAGMVVSLKDTHVFDPRGPFLQFDDEVDENGELTFYWIAEARRTEHASALFEAFTTELIIQAFGTQFGFRGLALHPEVR